MNIFSVIDSAIVIAYVFAAAIVVVGIATARPAPAAAPLQLPPASAPAIEMPAPEPTPEPVANLVIAPAPVPTLRSLIVEAVSAPKPELPTSIRAARDLIRENGWQQDVKSLTGKSVSKCSKNDLLTAIEQLM